MNLLDKKYIHVGTNHIYKELWQNINMDQEYNSIVKPYGGLWCSNLNNEICDWLSYVRLEKEEFYNYLIYKPACMIKFKNDSKLLKIENKNDILNLKQSNLIYHLDNNPININKFYYSYNLDWIPNYDKISELYDLLYINPYIDKCFREYSINTLLVMTLDSIEYYNPIEIDIKNNTIKNIYKNEYIKENNDNYYDYVKYIESLFYDINENNYDKYIKKLKYLKNKIINDENNLIYLKDKRLLEAITNNIYIEKYKEKRKVLQL